MNTNTANYQVMNKEQLTKYLGTLLDIDGMNFWDNESDQVFYWDSDLTTVLNEIEDYNNYNQVNIYFEVIHLLDTNHDSYVALWN